MRLTEKKKVTLDDDLRALVAFIQESAGKEYSYACQIGGAAPFEPIPYDRDRLDGESEYIAECASQLFDIAEKIKCRIKISQSDYELATGYMQLDNQEFLPILRRCLK